MSAPAATRQPVLLVSGLSGAGKASILRALEDVGYEAVDNPPLELVEELVGGAGGTPSRRVAIGVDARSRGFDPDAVLAKGCGDRAPCGAGGVWELRDRLYAD